MVWFATRSHSTPFSIISFVFRIFCVVLAAPCEVNMPKKLKKNPKFVPCALHIKHTELLWRNLFSILWLAGLLYVIPLPCLTALSPLLLSCEIKVKWLETWLFVNLIVEVWSTIPECQIDILLKHGALWTDFSHNSTHWCHYFMTLQGGSYQMNEGKQNVN